MSQGLPARQIKRPRQSHPSEDWPGSRWGHATPPLELSSKEHGARVTRATISASKRLPPARLPVPGAAGPWPGVAEGRQGEHGEFRGTPGIQARPVPEVARVPDPATTVEHIRRQRAHAPDGPARDAVRSPRKLVGADPVPVVVTGDPSATACLHGHLLRSRTVRRRGGRVPLGAEQSSPRGRGAVLAYSEASPFEDLWCSSECTPACQAGGRGFKSRQVRAQGPPPRTSSPADTLSPAVG